MRVWGIEVDDPVNARSARRIFVAHSGVTCCGSVAVIWGLVLAFGVLPEYQELKARPAETVPDVPSDDDSRTPSNAPPEPEIWPSGPPDGLDVAANDHMAELSGYQTIGAAEDDGCRRNGKWHDAKKESLLSFVCEGMGNVPGMGSCPAAPYGAKWEVYNHSCFFHMQVPSHVTHPEAELLCKAQNKSTLAQIHSNAENKVVQRVCGSRECWIDLRQRSPQDWIWGDGTVPKFQNWEEGEPNSKDGSHLEAAFLNWGGRCNEYYGRYDFKQVVEGASDSVDDSWRVEHQVSLERQRLSIVMWALLHFCGPLGMLAMARVVLETKNANLAQIVCVCSGLASSCLAAQCLMSLLYLAALFAGKASHAEAVEDYRLGGPVKCAQDPGSIGFDSIEDCENAFASQLIAFYLFLVLVSSVALLLCSCGTSSAQQVHIRLRTANPVGPVTFPGGTYRAGTVQPPTVTGTAGVVIGAPVGASAASDMHDNAAEDGVGFMNSWAESGGVAAGTVVTGQQVVLDSAPQPSQKTVD